MITNEQAESFGFELKQDGKEQYPSFFVIKKTFNQKRFQFILSRDGDRAAMTILVRNENTNDWDRHSYEDHKHLVKDGRNVLRIDNISELKEVLAKFDIFEYEKEVL